MEASEAFDVGPSPGMQKTAFKNVRCLIANEPAERRRKAGEAAAL